MNEEKMLLVLDEEGIREMGIKGLRTMPQSCLVAHYLNETVGGRWNVSVSNATLEAEDGNVEVDLPLQVRHIILSFDRGCYPDLEEPE